MNASAFDPEQFLNQESDTSIDTTVIPIPAREHMAQIDKISPKKITIKSGENAGEERIVVDLTWAVLSEEAKSETGLDKPTVRQSVFIDLNENGAIDMSKGKNRKLGLIREAVKQNKDGKPWKLQDLQGMMATLVIGHKPDADDPEVVYSEVKKVLPS